VQWLKHALAVEPEGPTEPTPEQNSVVEKVCVEIVRRHLSTPALLFLEMSRPLNFLGAQAMHFFAPFVSAITNSEGHRHFAAFLEHRGSIDYIVGRVEELEAGASENDKNSETQEDDSPTQR